MVLKMADECGKDSRRKHCKGESKGWEQLYRIRRREVEGGGERKQCRVKETGKGRKIRRRNEMDRSDCG